MPKGVDFMYCIHCGCKLSEDSRFCSACGSAVTQNEIKADNSFRATDTDNANPYATVVNDTPSEAESVSFQPYTYNPQTPSPASQPQYLRPVNTPQGTMYVPVEPVTYYTRPVIEPKHNAFTFISAGISGVMILLLFMPWISVGGKGYNIITMLTESSFLERFDAEGFAVCSLFMFIILGMLIPALIFAIVRKNRMPVGFSIAASSLTFVNLFFFLIMADIATSTVSTTMVTVIMFFLAVANIVFPILARKK